MDLKEQLLALDGHTYRAYMARWLGIMRKRALDTEEPAEYEGLDAEMARLTPTQFVELRTEVTAQRKANHSSAEARRARYHATKNRRTQVARLQEAADAAPQQEPQ